MAKPPAKPLNQTPPPDQRPPGTKTDPTETQAAKNAAKRVVERAEEAAQTDAEAPAVEPAAADDFPEREAAEPPSTPKPLADAPESKVKANPVATKVSAPAARVTRDKATGKVKTPAAKAKAEEMPEVKEMEPAHPPPAGDNNIVAVEALNLFIERIERLEGEKQGIADDIRDVYTEAKLQGFNSAIMRDCVKIRKMEPDKRKEKYALLQLYASALGIDLGLDLI